MKTVIAVVVAGVLGFALGRSAATTRERPTTERTRSASNTSSTEEHDEDAPSGSGSPATTSTTAPSTRAVVAASSTSTSNVGPERVRFLEAEVLRLTRAVDGHQQANVEVEGTAIAFAEGHSAVADQDKF